MSDGGESSFFVRQPVAFLNIEATDAASGSGAGSSTSSSSPGVIGEPVQVVREPVVKNETLIPYVPLTHGHDLYTPPVGSSPGAPT
eukprot:SAG31_NODE_34624_length_331_cov_0.672414_1_plen_85_part_01